MGEEEITSLGGEQLSNWLKFTGRVEEVDGAKASGLLPVVVENRVRPWALERRNKLRRRASVSLLLLCFRASEYGG